jgi:hypothetical protein
LYSFSESRPINTTYGTNQDRLLARQSSLRGAPETKNISSQEAITLFNSRSAGAIHDYIQKERRSHTMAPLVRIVGPSSTITTQTFASTAAPSDAQTVKPSNATQIISNATDNLYAQLNAEMADATNNDYEVDVIGNNQEDDEEEEDDDDTPLIVKVQYDPDAGGPPSEDAIRQALDNKLKGQSRPRNANEPIVLNFLNHSTQTQIPSMRMRPQQPMFNRSAPSIPQSIIRSQQQQQQQQQSLLQQQLKQQQQLELQENQRQQQQRQQQEFLLQQQKQKQQLQQYIQQQLQLEQQRKQEQTRRERLQWEQQQIQKQLKAEQQKIQKQLKAEQNELKQLIQQQLQHEQQQQQQQRYQQLFQQQRNRQIYQSQQNESIQQNASLPPMGPRPSRTVPSIRTIPMNQSLATHTSNHHIHLAQNFSSAPMAIRNPQEFPTITIQKLPNRNIKSILTSDVIPTGLFIHLYNCFLILNLYLQTNQSFFVLNFRT